MMTLKFEYYNEYGELVHFVHKTIGLSKTELRLEVMQMTFDWATADVCLFVKGEPVPLCEIKKKGKRKPIYRIFYHPFANAAGAWFKANPIIKLDVVAKSLGVFPQYLRTCLNTDNRSLAVKYIEPLCAIMENPTKTLQPSANGKQ
jgi:hypothetical protein